MQNKKPKGVVDERQLFHGTKAEYVDAICRQNFDFRLSGQSYGTRYGKGSYFALEAKYSDKYADSNNRMVFVVKVLVGDYKQGEKTFVRPPSKDSSNKSSDLYDSCVDDEKNPKIFVIFDLYQAYPEFVVKYDIKAPKFAYWNNMNLSFFSSGLKKWSCFRFPNRPFEIIGWLVVLRLNVPFNNFSVMSGRSHRFLGN